MQCPYGREVGDPPRRRTCWTTTEQCWCEGDMAVALRQLGSGHIDPQADRVNRWWLDQARIRNRIEADQHFAERPTLPESG